MNGAAAGTRRRMGLVESGLLICALALVWTSVRLHHPEIAEPMHFDEWVDIGLALDVVRDEAFVFKPTDSGFHEVDTDIRNRNLEFGFFVFLGELSLLGGIDLVKDYHHLAPILAVFKAAALFVFVRAVAGGTWPALFAVFFIAAARSNNNLLGADYFLPMNLCMPFLLLVLTGLLEIQRAESRERRGWAIVIALSVPVLAFNHPPSLMTAILLAGLILVMSPRTWRDPRPLLALAGVGVVVTLGVAALLWKGSVGATVAQFGEFIVIPRRWHMNEFLAVPLTYFAPLPLLLLALGGLGVALARAETRFLVVWFVVVLVSDYAYRELRYSLLLPYQRMWHYWQLAVVTLGGMGLHALLHWVWLRLRAAPLGLRRATVAGLGAAAVVAVLALPNRDPFWVQADGFRHRITPAERSALVWVGANHPETGVLYTRPTAAPFVRPLSGWDAAYGPRRAFMRGERIEDVCASIATETRPPSLALVGRGAGVERCEGWAPIRELGPLTLYRKEQEQDG